MKFLFAFAAHLGTMKVSEEIDALTTFGFQPVDMLALPRVIALTLMMPLLTLYANLLGYSGGAVIGNSMLDISYTQYLFETQTIVTTPPQIPTQNIINKHHPPITQITQIIHN